MSQTTKIVFLKQSQYDNEGTLYVRQIENRKSKVKSLGIKLKETDFNNYWKKDKREFSKTYRNSEEYNDIIKDYFKNLNRYENLSNVPKDKKSFLKYWNKKIINTTNHGSKIKYEVVYSKTLKFLDTINKTDLLFKDITPTLIDDLRHYFLTSKDPKQLSNNTTNHYLKIIRNVIDLSIKEDEYIYLKHPFTTQKFVKDFNKKKVLTDSHISTLIETEIDNEILDTTRNMFLFQLFANGMRVSDLLLLRWKHFKDYRLHYTMYKTFFEINIPMNINMSLIISKYINFYENYDLTSKYLSIPFENNYSINPIKQQKVTLNDLDYILSKYNKVDSRIRPLTKSVLKMREIVRNANGSMVDYKGYKVEINDEEIRKVIDTRETLQNNINSKFITGLVKKINEKVKDDFVFSLLDKDLFKKFDIKKLSIEQYKNIKHNTIVYSRRLKKVQEICGIDVPLTSHVSRHSFTNQLLSMDNVNLYDISKSLGHSKIQTTENYIMEGFHTQKIDYISEKLSKKFSK